MANPRKPNRLKVVAGTNRKDRAVTELELPTLDEIPEPPNWLMNPQAIQEWERITVILKNNNMLVDLDLSYLGHLCNLHGSILKLNSVGIPGQTSAYATLRNMLSDFGVGPVARGKVSPVKGSNKPSNPFDNNGKK
jgi:phage terminase small subunit